MVGCCGDLGAHRDPGGCVLANCASDVCREVGTYRILARTAPDQDAALVQGYVALFNDPATIARLQAANHIPDGIMFEAKPVAASPIMTIEATADNAKAAETAAQDMAVAFRQDINAIHEAKRKKTLADLTSHLDTLSLRPTTDQSVAGPLSARPNFQHATGREERAPRPPTAGRRHHERATGCGQPGPPGCGWIWHSASLPRWARRCRRLRVRLTYGRRPTSNRWSRCVDPHLSRESVARAPIACSPPTW